VVVGAANGRLEKLERGAVTEGVHTVRIADARHTRLDADGYGRFTDRRPKEPEMRRIKPIFPVIVMFAVACQTTPPPPPPAPEPSPAPPPAAKKDPLTIGSVTVEKQALGGGDLVANIELGPDNSGTDASYTVKAGERTLSEGTAPLELDADKQATLTIPFTFGADYDALLAYQGNEITEVSLDVTIGGETRTRAFRVRSPLLPRVSILSVHASLEDKKTLAVTYRVEIKNPNPFEVRAGTLTYEALLADKSIAKTDLVIAGKIPGSSNAEYEVPAAATPENCGKDFTSIVNKSSAAWGFRGSLSVQGFSIPVDVSGTLKLSQ